MQNRPIETTIVVIVIAALVFVVAYYMKRAFANRDARRKSSQAAAASSAAAAATTTSEQMQTGKRMKEKKGVHATSLIQNHRLPRAPACFDEAHGMCQRVRESACLPPLERSEHLLIPSAKVANQLTQILGEVEGSILIQGSNIGRPLRFHRNSQLSQTETHQVIKLVKECCLNPQQAARLQVAIGWSKEIGMGVLHAVVAEKELQLGTQFTSPFTSQLWIPNGWVEKASRPIEDFARA